jgi:hypothetical protein
VRVLLRRKMVKRSAEESRQMLCMAWPKPVAKVAAPVTVSASLEGARRTSTQCDRGSSAGAVDLNPSADVSALTVTTSAAKKAGIKSTTAASSRTKGGQFSALIGTSTSPS